MSTYAEFLASKERQVGAYGRSVAAGDVHPFLHEWQARTVQWAVRKGRCAIFWDCGLGKTVAQLEWARLSGERALILAPLSVARQTVREARKVDMAVRYVRHQDEVDGPGVYITNYEMDHAFDPSKWDALVADESSILKHHTSETRNRLCKDWAVVPRRLACTATPAPNDIQELTNHSEFLGVMPRVEMLAAYFVHDDDGWRLKGHAVEPMWRWISSWATTARSPADLGYPDDAYNLPPLNIIEERVDHVIDSPDQLFATDIGGVGGRAAVRRETMDARIERVLEVIGANRSSQKAGIRPAVGEGESRTHPGLSSADGGRAQCPPEAALRRGFDSPSGDQGEGERLPEAHPDTHFPGVSEVQGGRLRAGTDDERRLCDLPGASALRPQGEAARGSRPLNGSGEGHPLPVVQPGSGSCSRRSDRGSGDVRLLDEAEPWIIWCGLNEEQDVLARILGKRAISIYGSLSPEEKERRLNAWLDGVAPILISKPAVCGVGLNLQRAHRMAFVGIGDSYEAYYQAIRRCYRFGQTEAVDAHIVVSAIESQIVANVRRKEQQDRDRITHLVRYSREELHRAA